MKRIVFIFVVIALFPLATMGQSYIQKEKPFWVDGYFREMDNSYLEIADAFDYDLNSARDRAMKEIIKKRSVATGTSASVALQNGQIEVTSADHQLIVKARIIDEYIIHGPNGYTVYLLVQTAKNPTYPYEQVTVSDDYGFSIAALVPGMAQIKKGSTVKGLSIIAAEAIAVGGIIVCENLRATNVKKMKEQPKFAKEYSNRAGNWETGRNICIGAAAGIWVYNVIDALVAKGKKRLFIKRPDGSGLSMGSFVTPEHSGVSLAYRF